MKRVVVDEILDGLAPEDPEAVRSRADLRRINFLMGNERWVVRQVAAQRECAADGVVELGAGTGALLRKLAAYGPSMGVDLVPRPAGLPGGVGWWQGDALAGDFRGGVLVANLFLHHFDEGGLRRLGGVVSRFRVLLAVEPWRSRLALGLGAMMNPLVGRVTRHDMAASIRAGFVPGELGEALGLEGWKFEESISRRGAVRILGRRAG